MKTEAPSTEAPSRDEREAAGGVVAGVRIHPLAAVRALAVTFGGSATLAGAAAVSAIDAIRAVLRRRRPGAASLAGLAAAVAYAAAVRPWMRDWGATPAEPAMPLPGDELVPDAAAQTTRAVTIRAPVEEVWPWVAQLGQDRGGFYSFEWLENLAGCRMHNADRIHPEWQRREVGEKVMLHPAVGLEVTRFEPNRALGLEGWGTWVLGPVDGGRTRLIIRGRRPRGPVLAAYYLMLMELPHFVMERQMLLGIKGRAEGAQRAEVEGPARR